MVQRRERLVYHFPSGTHKLMLIQYRLSSRTLKPSHDPMYYTRIREGVHLSAQGKGRSWWKSFFQLKGDA